MVDLGVGTMRRKMEGTVLGLRENSRPEMDQVGPGEDEMVAANILMQLVGGRQ